MPHKQPRRPELTTYRWKQLRLKILNRDHWICGMCGGPIDRDAPAGTRWSATVDHITPVSAGGSIHDEHNLRAAHHACNSGHALPPPPSKASRQW